MIETQYTELKEIANFLGISRMQLYRWSKLVPMPQWHWGYGIRRNRVKAWTEADIKNWIEQVRMKTGTIRGYNGRCYKLWR